MSNQSLPKIGLGTWMLKPREAEYSTLEALKLGYRFIDTAQAYRNEEGVGRGLKEAFKERIVDRTDVFVATKIFPLYLRQKTVKKVISKSLQKLQLDYIDLMYVHWPAFLLGYSHSKTLNAIGEFVDEGKINHIGISNFTIQHTIDAQKECKKSIFANQIEHHPYLQQEELIKFLKEQDIHIISYSPLGRGHVLKDPVILDIAKKNDLSPAQVCLAWIISKDATPIPKATSLDHLIDNLKSTKVDLSQDDIDAIDKITITYRYVNPPFVSPKEWKN